MKFWITIFIFWVVWKVAKSVIDELQARTQNQPPPKGREPVVPPAARTPRQQAPSRQLPHPGARAARRQGEQHPPAEPMSDMERLFREAMAQKSRMEEQPARPQRRPAQPRTARPRVARPRPEPEPEPWLEPEPEPEPWIPPRPEPRREARPEPRRVAVPREPVAPEPAKKAPKPPAPPPKRRKRREARRRVAGAERPAAIPLIGRLDKNDVRRGVVIAELLGPPKALRDIDSHVI